LQLQNMGDGECPYCSQKLHSTEDLMNAQHINKCQFERGTNKNNNNK